MCSYHDKYLGEPAREPDLARDAKWAVSLCLLMVLLLAWGHAVDTDQQQGDDDAYAAGVVAGRLEMQATVADAYRMGQADARLDADPCAQAPLFERRALRVALRDVLCGGQAPDVGAAP